MLVGGNQGLIDQGGEQVQDDVAVEVGIAADVFGGVEVTVSDGQ